MAKIPIPNRTIHSVEDMEDLLDEIEIASSPFGRTTTEDVYMKDDDDHRLKSLHSSEDIFIRYKNGEEVKQTDFRLANDILSEGEEITKEEYYA